MFSVTKLVVTAIVAYTAMAKPSKSISSLSLHLLTDAVQPFLSLPLESIVSRMLRRVFSWMPPMLSKVREAKSYLVDD